MSQSAKNIDFESMNFPVEKVRSDFQQVLKTQVHGKPLVYLDNAASTLKPRSVVEAISHHYQFEASNIHRGVHFLSEHGTTLYENARKKIQKFIGACEDREIIFTSGTTDSLNLVARSYGDQYLKEGDEILISEMEHHSNIVPWQMLCERRGCQLRVIPVDDCGDLIMDEFDKLLTDKTKLVSVVYASNTLGTINPVKEIIQKSHAKGAKVVVDAAQAIAHLNVDVKDLDCDFLAFSSHKIFGPTGFGVLYGKSDLLEAMPPIQGGGDMIDTVTFEKTTYNVIPHKFEAGTPHIAGAIGLGEAIDYVQSLGLDAVAKYEDELLQYATKKLKEIGGLKIIGEAQSKSAIASFVIDGVHPHDLGTLVDQEGVAIRTGHHCTQPLMARYGVSATARASFSIYNTKNEIDIFIDAVNKAMALF